MVWPGKGDVDVARGRGAFYRAAHDAGRFVGDNAWLVLDIVSFEANDLGGMEDKAMAISRAVGGRNGGCATGMGAPPVSASMYAS